jgi:glycosyltransferase involved in cell wall biosynthesis
MKITFLTPTLELHGGNIVMLKHADYLIKNGHEVTIITTTKPIELPVNSKIKILQYKKVGPKYFDFFTFQLVYLNKVVNLVEDADYIIPIYAPLIIHAIKAKRKKKLKAKIVPLFQDSLVTLWAGPYIRMILKTRYLRDNIFKVVAVSRPGAEGYEKLSGVKPTFIPIAIEDDHFHPRDLKKEDYILFVGRPNKAKGFPIFKEAYKIISKEIPGIKAKVVSPVMGDKIEDGIEYIKYKDREQLAEIYNKAKVYVNASFAESFPMPPLEAMASGTAVVVTNTGGEQEYAVDQKNALIVPMGDVKAIADATIELIRDDAKRSLFEKNGIETSKKYTWSKSNREYQDFLIKNFK